MSFVEDRAPFQTHSSYEYREIQPQFATTSTGAGAVVWVEKRIAQGACACPVTSSTTLGGKDQAETANGQRNLWGEELAFVEPRPSEYFCTATVREPVSRLASRLTAIFGHHTIVMLQYRL